jgi:hypothetical protein
MKITDLSQPGIGDIVEFETDPETVVEGLIVGETDDGYIYEFSESGYQELEETCTHGKYYCSTDRKWKCRQGPKQTREVAEASGYVAKTPAEARDPRYSASLSADVGLHTMRNQIADFFPTAAPKDRQTQITEATYQGREVPLGRPIRGDVKKFKVYVKNKAGKVVKVNFGDPNMRIRKSNPARRKSFRARHNCANPGPRWKARYWSCRKW